MGSLFGKLNIVNVLKGALVAAFAIIATGIGNMLQTGVLPNWNSLVPILLVGVSTFLGYLVKNLFTNSAGQTFVSEKNVLKNVTTVDPLGEKTTVIVTKT